jgi:undecaprenyl-diphosphatase
MVYKTNSWVINIKPVFWKEILVLVGYIPLSNEREINIRNGYRWYLAIYAALFGLLYVGDYQTTSHTMTIGQSVVLGVVEGVTEFLPISSTGHLILVSDLLRIANTEFLKSFEIIIQLGAITSVLFLYWRTLTNYQQIKKILVAFLPTAVLGVLAYGTVKKYLLGNSQVVVWALVIGGAALIVFERWYRKSGNRAIAQETISYRQAVLIGVCQSVAMIPGVSRSAATIVGGLLLGLDRKSIVEFSFLLAVPTMVAASALDVSKSYQVFASDQYVVLGVGFMVSFIVATMSIKFLLRYVQKHDFSLFGIYRIVAGILFWWIIIR